MSNEAVLQDRIHHEPPNEIGLIQCPYCGFKIPESIVICWKCGARLKN